MQQIDVLKHLNLRLEARKKLYKNGSNIKDFDREKAINVYRRLEDAVRIIEGSPPQYFKVQMVIWELERTIFQLNKIENRNSFLTVSALESAVNIIKLTI